MKKRADPLQTPVDGDAVRVTVAKCFGERRREIILVLGRRFGFHRLDEIEAALQAAAERALLHWPDHGIPPNPVAWLITVSRNLMIDAARRIRQADAKSADIIDLYYADEAATAIWAGPLDDDVLKMMIACADPDLTQREALVIILRLVCNMTAEEIAKGLLSSVSAVRKQLTRAKARIRGLNLRLDLPPEPEIAPRLDRVMLCIYVLYNEGYLARDGSNLIRRDLCGEAERLVELLLKSTLQDKGKIWALKALLDFQSARAPARVDAKGRALSLAEQDRSLWNATKISHGLAALGHSMRSAQRSRYHLEAAIAATHSTADSFDTTDWPAIRDYYHDLAEIYPSPVVDLNRSVAVMMTDGPDAAIELLQRLKAAGALKDTYLLPALLGDFNMRAGRVSAAETYYREALTFDQAAPVHSFLLGQIEICEASRGGPAERSIRPV